MRLNHAVASLSGLLIIVTAPLVLSASPVYTVPMGLNPGDQYRLVFVTSSTISATSTNISDYDNFVNAVAKAAGSPLQSLGATWQAVVSTAAVSAADHLGSFSTPIFRLDGAEVATGSAGLWSGSILQSIDFDEQGAAASPVVWTGTAENGSAKNPLGGQPNIEVGCATISNSLWIDLTMFGSDAPALPLYGISSVLTVPVPETGGVTVLLTGLFFLLGTKRYMRSR